ncbi:MAG: hypothetical protein ACK56I_19590, partial [bacterium]
NSLASSCETVPTAVRQHLQQGVGRHHLTHSQAGAGIHRYRAQVRSRRSLRVGGHPRPRRFRSQKKPPTERHWEGLTP